MKRPIAPARAVLLCAVITASVLGGCGNSGESNTSSVPDSASTVSSGTASEESVPSTESSKESEAPAPAGNSDFRYSTVQRYDENNNLFDAIVIEKYVGSGKDVTVPEKIEDKPVVSVGASAFEGTAVETVEINDNISRIEYSCFKNCSALKSVKLPSKLTTIDFNVFENCTALESIEIPEGVTIISGESFKGCSSLKEVKFPNSLASLDSCSFMDCTSLSEITLPSEMTYCGYDVFNNTAFYNNAPEGDVYIGNVYYAYKVDTDAMDGGHDKIKELSATKKKTFKEGTRLIAGLAFYNSGSNKDLEPLDIEIPDSVVFVGGNAFYWLNLGSINISAEVAKNSASMCFGTYVKELRFASDVTELHDYLLSNINIETLEIPASVRKIGGDTLSLLTDTKTIIIHEGTEYLGERNFTFCENLEKVYVPASVKEVDGDYEGEFYESPKIVIYTPAGSYMESFCKEHNITYKTVKDESEFLA